jgi:hypothetical protein
MSMSFPSAIGTPSVSAIRADAIARAKEKAADAVFTWDGVARGGVVGGLATATGAGFLMMALPLSMGLFPIPALALGAVAIGSAAMGVIGALRARGLENKVDRLAEREYHYRQGGDEGSFEAHQKAGGASFLARLMNRREARKLERQELRQVVGGPKL